MRQEKEVNSRNMQVVVQEHEHKMRQEKEVNSKNMAALKEDTQMQLAMKDKLHAQYIETYKQQLTKEHDAKLETLKNDHAK